MTAEEFLDAVRADQKTELSRLGSSKSLYADTEGEMNPEPVLDAIADHLSHATKPFEAWADEEDGSAGDFFADTADTLADLADTVAEAHGDYESGDTPAIVAYLQGLDATAERVAGAVGWALASEKKIGQAVGFFVGQASPQTASTFRGVRDDVEAVVDAGTDVLAEVCDDDDDWNTAREAAIGAVAAAYDEYFETLENLGVNPKPVC
jgi:hypothetical protein